MTIVTPTYRPKRAPRKKRKQPPIANRIVEPEPMKPRKGPMIRLREDAEPFATNDPAPKRSAIVTQKRKPNAMHAHLFEDLTEEEVLRRADAAEELFRDIVRRVNAERHHGRKA